jgi:hypothetical protein
LLKKELDIEVDTVGGKTDELTVCGSVINSSHEKAGFDFQAIKPFFKL